LGGGLVGLLPMFDSEKPPFMTYLIFIDLCIDRNRLDIAADFVKKTAALIVQPSDRAALMARQAEVFAARGNSERASAVLDKLKGHRKYKELGFVTEGKILLRQNMLSEFIRCYQRLADSSKSAHAMELLGEAFVKTRDVSMATATFRRGLHFDPSSESMIRATIHCLVQSHRFEEAVELFVASVNFLLATGYAAIHLIQLMINLNRFHEAEQCILKVQKTLHISNRHLIAQYSSMQATVYCGQKRYNESEKCFADAIRLMEELCKTDNENPFVTKFHQNLSKVYERAADNSLKLQHYDRARDCYQKALQHDSLNVSAVSALFNHYKVRFDVERCQKVCLDYLAIDPENETVVLLLTSIASNFRDLIPHLEKVLAAKPRSY
jgi:tetratricopeptide (TPR) repeat protein